MADKITQAAVTGTGPSSIPFSDKDLLQELGIRGMRRMAGFIPALSTEPLPEAAPIDERPLCNARTVKQFLWLINKNFNGLRAMWIQKFIDTGQRLPDELLPTLMDKHSSRFGIPSFIHASVGERARWLANLPDTNQWQWYRRTRSNDGSTSRFGVRLGRHGEYRELRYESLELAQVWLDKHWHEMNITDCLSILSILRDTVSRSDLPFLKVCVETLHEVHDAELLQEIWYLISILAPELLDDIVQEFMGYLHLSFEGKRNLPVLDLRWSNSFLENSQYIPQGVIRKLAAKQLWWDNLSHLVRLVPLDCWLQKWNSDIETLLNGARQGLHGHIFIPMWIQRAIDEDHEAFALAILRHQKPQINRFGWHVSHQSKLLDKLSFESLQTLIDEVWMNPEKEITWHIP